MGLLSRLSIALLIRSVDRSLFIRLIDRYLLALPRLDGRDSEIAPTVCDRDTELAPKTIGF